MNNKTPAQIKGWLDNHLHLFDNPCCYYGDEPNSFLYSEEEWHDATIRHLVCSAFPYTEFVGNHSIPLLYKYYNEAKPSWIAERCHFPTSHREVKMLSKAGIPMFGLETKHAIQDFHTIGFSVNWSPQNLNVIKMMRMSGIPFRWRDRVDMKEKYPLLLYGSNCAANPYSMTSVIDIFWMGDLEDEPGNPGFVAVWSDFEASIADGSFYTKDGREELLHKLARDYDFLFIPRFIKTRLHTDSKTIKDWGYKYPDINTTIRRRYIVDLDGQPPVTNMVVSYYDTSMGIGEIETSRGCPASCTFCSSRVRYAPFRVRSEDKLFEAFKEAVRVTGAETVSPLTLEFGDYPTKKSLVSRLVSEVSDDISCPSLRVDVWDKDPDFAQILNHAGKEQVTLAVEGNSERMRTAVSKGIDEAAILNAVRNAIAAGFRRLKVYMIADIPGETIEDTEELATLARKIDELRRSMSSKMMVRFSWTPINIQAHTPLQWCATTLERRDLGRLFKPLKDVGCDFTLGKKAETNMRYFTQLMELADSRASEALLDTMEEMDVEYLGGVSRQMKEVLGRHLGKRGLTFDDFFSEKPEDYVFDWDIIDMRVSKEYLLRTYRQMKAFLAGEYVPKRMGFLPKFGKCNYGCDACGACTTKEQKALTQALWKKADQAIDLSRVTPKDEKSAATKYRFSVWVDPWKRFVPNNHWVVAIRRACYLMDLPITKKSIRFASDNMKFKEWTAGVDIVELAFTKDVGMTWQEVQDKINVNLRGISLQYGDKFPANIDSLKKEAGLNFYELEIQESASTIKNAIARFERGDKMDLVLRKEEYNAGLQRTVVDLQDYLDEAWVVKSGTSLYLKMFVRGVPSPYDVLASLFKKRPSDVFRFPAIKLGSYIDVDQNQDDFFTSRCEECGRVMPTSVLGSVESGDLCFKCKDAEKGIVLTQ